MAGITTGALYTPERIDQLNLLHRLVCEQHAVDRNSAEGIELAARIFAECGDGNFQTAMALQIRRPSEPALNSPQSLLMLAL